MNNDPKNRGHSSEPANAKWVLIGFSLIAAFFLVGEHRVHVFGLLPYLLILACPLLHYFMHGKHGGHGKSEDPQYGDSLDSHDDLHHHDDPDQRDSPDSHDDPRHHDKPDRYDGPHNHDGPHDLENGDNERKLT